MGASGGQWPNCLSTKFTAQQCNGIPAYRPRHKVLEFLPHWLDFLSLWGRKIKSIPICSFTQLDLLFWPSTNYGNYAVKSGYHLLCADEDSELASVSDGATSRSFWNRLWKMNFPNKVKTFMWRACSDSLPTLKKLVQKTITSSPLCASCLQAPEDVLHALWGCTNLL